MAKPQSSEPKAPLIVATAFFVLATLVLGVLFYLETDKKASAVAEAKKANDDKSNADKLRAEEQDKVRMYRVVIGVNEAEELTALAGSSSPKVKEEFDKFRASLESKLKALVDKRAALIVGQGTKSLAPVTTDLVNWTALAAGKADKEPERTLADAVVTALANQLLAAGRLTTAEKTLETATASYQTQAAAAEAAKKTLEQTIDKVKADAAADIAKREKELADYRSAFNTRTNEYTKNETTAKEEATRQNILLEESRGKALSLDKQLERSEDRAQAQEDPFRMLKPLGKIVRRERGSNTVYIDLGSADNVPVGLRLTVQPSNTPEVGMAGRLRPRLSPTGRPVLENGQQMMEMVPKGRIEVVAVEGPNLSRCRITGEADPVRDRVEFGDLLYNASWRRGKTDTVALYGVFDANGDGSDDTRAVIRDLQKMGITVAAYYDLEQRKWLDPSTGRPTAVTEQVIYAIEGAYPLSQAGDSLAGARSDLIAALDAAKQQAKDRGVKLVKARNYFPQIGYEYRGGDVSPDRINQAYNRYLRTAPPADAPPPEGK